MAGGRDGRIDGQVEEPLLKQLRYFAEKTRMKMYQNGRSALFLPDFVGKGACAGLNWIG